MAQQKEAGTKQGLEELEFPLDFPFTLEKIAEEMEKHGVKVFQVLEHGY